MVRKKNIVLQEVEQYTRYCDICGDEISHEPLCYACKRDICKKCVAKSEFDGDKLIIWCPDCWNIEIIYREKLKLLDKEYEKIIVEKMYMQKQRECE